MPSRNRDLGPAPRINTSIATWARCCRPSGCDGSRTAAPRLGAWLSRSTSTRRLSVHFRRVSRAAQL